MKQQATAPAVFKTAYQQEKEEKDLAIYNEFRTALENDPAASKEAITAYCMEKYKVHSRSGVWAARKRGEALSARQGGSR